jgi:glycosyl transferase family 1
LPVALQRTGPRRQTMASVNIGVFSKFECAGGSEFRCAEMANALSQVPGHRATLLAERQLSARVRNALRPEVEVVEGVFSKPRVETLYALDTLLVVNTDSKDFTSADYWLGKSSRHAHPMELRRVPKMVFLFNFIVSPARHLWTIRDYVDDVRMITANRKFFNEISEQDRYARVQHFPRLCLESPIALDSVSTHKIPSATVRLGMHSKGLDNKWNAEFYDLITALRDLHGDAVSWSFMGMPRGLAEKVRLLPNVRVRPEFGVTVREFLAELDVFAYFASWRREEPWSRSVAEALTSGCPVVATDKGGNRDQIVHGNNGFLCHSLEQFIARCDLLVRDPEHRRAMGHNAMVSAQRFSSPEVVRRFLAFVNG